MYTYAAHTHTDERRDQYVDCTRKGRVLIPASIHLTRAYILFTLLYCMYTSSCHLT